MVGTREDMIMPSDNDEDFLDRHVALDCCKISNENYKRAR